MTPETLKLYEKLQPLFREKMGLEQTGDRIFDARDNMYGFIISIDGNRLDYITGDGSVYWTKLVDAIRLPLPIDPVNPERGLWGMVDWKRFKILSSNDDGTVTIAEPGRFIGRFSATEALLRALCEQELMI